MKTRTRSTTVTISLPNSLIEAVDRTRGDVPRSMFVRRALESVLADRGALPLETDSSPVSAPAPSRASADEEAVEQASARKASQRSPAPARRRSKVPAGPQASPPSDVSSSASQGREVEAGVNGGAGAALRGQTTVEEMLASCPNCAGDFHPRAIPGTDGIFDSETGEFVYFDESAPKALVCEDCGYVREPS
jgi:hypothetical protein